MAEAIAFCLARKIIKSLGSMAFKEIGSMWGVEDELEKLKDTVSAVHDVLLDEEQQDKSHRVKHWIKKLRDPVYDADDLLTEFYTEDLRRRVMYGSDIMMVPNSIEKLTFLKYLDLSGNNIKVLPNSITRLLNLQTLNLSYCYKLKELPGNIQNLFNLRNLELIGCYNLTHMPPGIGQLTSLQVLPLFIVNEELEFFF